MFIGNYGMEADMWAAGMMMYQLLADRFPWCASTALVATHRLMFVQQVLCCPQAAAAEGPHMP